LRRMLFPLEKKTLCSLEYDMPDREIRADIIEKDNAELMAIGPSEIQDDCWHIPGSMPVLLTAPHAAGPRSDDGVSDLVFRAQTGTGAHAVLATISRKILDLNNISLAAEPFFEKIQDLIDHGVKLLVDVHSMNGKAGHDIEIGSLCGDTLSLRKRDIMKEMFEKSGFKVAVDLKWIGGAVVGIFSKDIETVQIEISRQIIRNDEVVNILCAIVNALEKQTRIQN